jgi:hypothetical protein
LQQEQGLGFSEFIVFEDEKVSVFVLADTFSDLPTPRLERGERSQLCRMLDRANNIVRPVKLLFLFATSALLAECPFASSMVFTYAATVSVKLLRTFSNFVRHTVHVHRLEKFGQKFRQVRLFDQSLPCGLGLD